MKIGRTKMSKLRSQIILVMGCIFILMACQKSTDIELFENYANRDNTTHTMLDLFYGMNQDSLGNYYDSELDGIDGLLYKEYRSEWKNSEDTTSFIMSIGLYIDKEFPSDVAKRIMLVKVDSVLTEGMTYDLPENELISLKSQMFSIPDSVSLFLDLWNYNFNRWTKIYNKNSPPTEYHRILNSRGCVVCHRVYEDANWITYILESSVSYHGSLGCPSAADYITINKRTGHILTKDDILQESKLKTVYNQLPLVYVDNAKRKGFTPHMAYEGEGLLRRADGLALINEGLLVYYHPYSLGCGAEGQYNLIVPLN